LKTALLDTSASFEAKPPSACMAPRQKLNMTLCPRLWFVPCAHHYSWHTFAFGNPKSVVKSSLPW
jgi:hypothetical protein